ncbi:hypothetical protein LINPERHAP1_LOCUS29113 [Linum perenne]
MLRECDATLLMIPLADDVDTLPKRPVISFETVTLRGMCGLIWVSTSGLLNGTRTSPNGSEGSLSERSRCSLGLPFGICGSQEMSLPSLM